MTIAVVGIALVVAAVACLTAALLGARSHPEWNWQHGPARWLGTAAVLLLGAGFIYLVAF